MTRHETTSAVYLEGRRLTLYKIRDLLFTERGYDLTLDETNDFLAWFLDEKALLPRYKHNRLDAHSSQTIPELFEEYNDYDDGEDTMKPLPAVDLTVKKAMDSFDAKVQHSTCHPCTLAGNFRAHLSDGEMNEWSDFINNNAEAQKAIDKLRMARLDLARAEHTPLNVQYAHDGDTISDHARDALNIVNFLTRTLFKISRKWVQDLRTKGTGVS